MQLNDSHLDILREISHVGVGNASMALSKITGSKIDLSIPMVKILQLEKISDLVGGVDTTIAAIHFKVLGDARGEILMMLPDSSAISLIGRLLNKEIKSLDNLKELDSSVLRETGNILTSAYLSAVSKLLNISLYPSVPGLIIDKSETIMDQMISEVDHPDGVVLILETRFIEELATITGRLFLVLDRQSINIMIEAAEELTS